MALCTHLRPGASSGGAGRVAHDGPWTSPLAASQPSGPSSDEDEISAPVVSGSGSNQLKENQRGSFVRGAAWAAVVLPVISAELSRGAGGVDGNEQRCLLTSILCKYPTWWRTQPHSPGPLGTCIFVLRYTIYRNHSHMKDVPYFI